MSETRNNPKFAKLPIKPLVRDDGVSLVDKYHFADGSPIQGWTCTNNECRYQTEHTSWEDDDTAHAEATGGFYGPNGNGYNYWCPKCGHRMNLDQNTYSALDSFFGFNQ